MLIGELGLPRSLHGHIMLSLIHIFIEVSRIGQLVEIDDAAIGILVHEQPHHMAADEPGSAGNQNIFHKLGYFNLFISVLRQQNRCV